MFGCFHPGFLQKTFTSLGFEICYFVCETAQDIEKTLHEVALGLQYKDWDSFVCVLVSRGDSECVFGEELSSRFPLARIKRTFLEDVCPSLLGKPKVFFIQTYLVSEGHRGSDSLLEIDGPFASSVDFRAQQPSMAHGEDDVFWSECTADASLLDNASSTRSQYLWCLSQKLQEGRKRPLMDLHIELKNHMDAWNSRVSPKEKYHVCLKDTLRKTLIFSST